MDAVERKLAAILHADVVGYSRLVELDEEGTHRIVRARIDDFGNVVRSYDGRVVNTAGDAILAEFGSVVAALRCAVTAQREMAGWNEELPDERKVRLRIGVNLGDVIVDGQNIYGNGVNVAERLEKLAEPGGICVSERVVDQIEKNVDVGFEYMGPQDVKNIEKQVNAYKVLLGPADVGKVLGMPTASATRRFQVRRWLATAVALLVLSGGVAGVWYFQAKPDFEPASMERMAHPLPDKPSIAVLALRNRSEDPKQEHFSDAISENIITELSRYPELFVIAPNSSFAYKDREKPIPQVAEELGVRYVVAGSLQREGERVRVSVQLVNALAGNNIWVGSYDREVRDIFDIQDEISRTIVATVAEKVELKERERVMQKHPASLEAYEYQLRGLEYLAERTREGNDLARQMLGRAVELDPDFASAYTYLAYVSLNGYRYGWTDLPPDAELARAQQMAQKALELAPHNFHAQSTMAYVHVQSGDLEQANPRYERALELNPNSANVLAESIEPLVYSGRPGDAIARLKKAMRLNPHHPDWFYWNLGWAQYYAEQYDEALASMKKMAKLPNMARRTLASIYVRLGRLDEAQAEIAELIKNEPSYTLERFRLDFLRKFTDPADVERMAEDLRVAGLEP